MKKINIHFGVKFNIIIFIFIFLLEILFFNPTWLESKFSSPKEISISNENLINCTIDSEGYIEFKGNTLSDPYIIIPNFNSNLYNLYIEMDISEITDFNLTILKSNSKNVVETTNQVKYKTARTLVSRKYEFNNLKVYESKDIYIFLSKLDSSTFKVKINKLVLNPVVHINWIRIAIMYFLVILGYFIYIQNNKGEVSLSKIFIIIGLTFGILFAFTEPPFQLPDETPHFLRSVYISEGNFDRTGELSNLNEPPGTYVNSDMIEKIMSCFYGTYGLKENVTRFFNMHFNIESTKIPIWNSAMLNPAITYIPSALWIKCANLFNLPISMYIYGARIINLLIYIVIITWVLKKYQTSAKIIFLVALFPMTLRQAANLSQDMIINAISFLLFASIIEEYNKNEPLKIKKLIQFFILTVFLGYVKFIYFFIIFLIWGIPMNRFKNKKYCIFCKVLLPILVGIVLIIYSYITLTNGTAYVNDQASPNEQISFILSNIFTYYRIFIDTLTTHITDFIYQSVGWLGWNSIQINPFTCLFIWIASIVIISLDNSMFPLSLKQKIICLLTTICGVGLIITASYVYWSPLGNEIALSTQGRYFIPLIPIIFLLIKSKYIVYTGSLKKINMSYFYVSYIGLFLTYIELFSRLYFN